MRRPRAEVVVHPLDRTLLDGLPDPADPEAPAVPVDVAVLPWFSDERPLQGLLGLLDWRADGALSTLVRNGFCSGEAGESTLVPAARGIAFERIVLIGCGPREGFDDEAARAAGERAVQVASGLRPSSVVLALPSVLAERDMLESMFEGALRELAAQEPTDPVEVMTTPAHRWFVVADARHVARLRRLLDGPLRAAVETSSSS